MYISLCEWFYTINKAMHSVHLVFYSQTCILVILRPLISHKYSAYKPRLSCLCCISFYTERYLNNSDCMFVLTVEKIIHVTSQK